MMVWVRRWCAALAVCVPVVSLLCWVDLAAAGCGDYVIFRPQAGLVQQDSAIPLPFAMPSPLARHTGEALPAEAPCHGPMCRGSKPVDPAPTPPLAQQLEQHPLALLAGETQVPCPFLAGGGWPRLDETPLDGFRQSLLRPPCA